MKRILLTLMMIVYFGTIHTANAAEEGKELLHMTLKEDQKKRRDVLRKKICETAMFWQKKARGQPVYNHG